MITRIEAFRYRCFEQLDVPFGAFQVLAGANGSGKTTLLDIPVVIGDMLRSRNVAAAFTERLLERGARVSSLEDLVFRGEREDFVLAIEAAVPQGCIRYEVGLRIRQNQLEVYHELLTLKSGRDAGDPTTIVARASDGLKIMRETIREGEGGVITNMDPTLLALARLRYESVEDFPAAHQLLDLLLGGVVYFDPQWADLRRASPPGLPRTLMASGQNLPWLAMRLQKHQPEQFDGWVEHVRTALPQITSISAREREEDHHAYFSVSYEGGFTVTSSGLSEGTLRILALTLVAYIPEAPSMLIVEEPRTASTPKPSRPSCSP